MASAKDSKSGPAATSIVADSDQQKMIAAVQAEAAAASTAGAPKQDVKLSNETFPLDKIIPPKTDRPLMVLISCGSFSPVTYLHLRLFEMARDHLQVVTGQFEVIGGFLSPVHDAYGKKSLIPAPHRVAMCEAAVADSAWINTTKYEVQQTGWTRTAVALAAYSSWLNSCGKFNRAVRVTMLCGADLLQSFTVPNLWSASDMASILSQGLVVLTRAGVDLTDLLNHAIIKPYKQNVSIVPVTIENNISSTAVRDAITAGCSVKYLIPDAVAGYIYRHNLYGHDPKKNPKQSHVLPVN